VKKKEVYDIEFYKSQVEDSYKASRKVLEMFKQYYQPKSVIDVGCGVGTWLKTWQALGVDKIYGLDCNTIDDNLLYVSREHIGIVDLEKHENLANETYELVMSIEVAEHLNPNASEAFVKLLTSYGDVVLFSAAIPKQPGNNHINCQPPKYWVELFNKQGYECFDFLRKKNMELGIGWSPTQNMFLYVKRDKLSLFESQGFIVDNDPMFFYCPKWVDFLLDQNKTQADQYFILSYLGKTMKKLKKSLRRMFFDINVS